MHQLTFAGARAGEGYFSPDGRYMIFQSERQEDNPFYQIYLMDLEHGTSRRVSPGQGKTSCSWIHPGLKRVLFASTHADPKLKEKTAEEIETRKSGKKAKYAWSFDDAFDIYQADFDGKHLKNLTHTPGYDAEGSYSPDGRWIAFASNRLAFTEPMNEEQKKMFARDPSYMMDIYIMKADGTQVKRLTSAPGYDGGPFFSPDGHRLTFRRFSPDGGSAEVYTIGIDGKDEKQITQMKAMSWAPFYHPSGDYLIFTTNKMGYANFELYIVDVEGKHEPVRVTDLPGFDGLPVFTPDGAHLVWSHANEKGEAQLYKAHWNDTLARQALDLPPRAPEVKHLQSAIDASDARAWVEYLASEHMQGRMTGSRQEQEYMNVLAAAFKDMGLKPVGANYVTDYEFTSGVELRGHNELDLRVKNSALSTKLQEDWMPLSYSKSGEFAAAPVVFAGYGIVAPATGNQAAYDSYGDLDVKGKWVAVFNGLPDDIGNERRFHLHLYSRLQHKAMMARQRGAVGLLVLDDSAAPKTSLKLQFEGRSEDAGIPALRLSPALADKLFAANGTDRKAWTTRLAKGEIATLPMPAATLGARIGLAFKTAKAHNVTAMLRVPGATSTLVLGAHGDHLGHGEMGNSLWRGEGSSIHTGADDNASGVAGVMEVAQDLSARVKRKDIRLKQNIVFAVWSGEEIGLFGSNAFLRSHPKLKISAYLNMDMIGRYRDQLLVQGTASAPEWKGWIERIGGLSPLIVRTQDDPYLPTDAMAFYMKQIPVVSLFTGSHREYHTPADRAELLNFDGLAQSAHWLENLTVALAQSPSPAVTYRKVESSRPKDENRGFRLYLGTIPDYSQEGKNGVVISGTSKDSPAEKAGLQPGDTIIELGGMKIQNLYDYVYCLQAMKAGEATRLRVVRQGKEKDLQITPVLKTQ
jgi:Tol biopolymer transport system component